MLHNDLHFRENTVALSVRDAAIRPRTFDATANTIEAIVATDNPVRRIGQDGTEFLEVLSIDGADLTTLRGASVLDSHNQHNGVSAVLGTVDEAWREANSIIARVRLSSRDEVAPIVADIRAGILASVSVGYEVTTWADSVGANGIPIRTATAWRPREVSFVAVAADPSAKTRSQSAPQQGHAAQMRQLAYRAGIAPETVDQWVDRGWTMDQARGAILDQMITRGTAMISAHNHSTMDNPSFATRAVGDAIYARMAGTAPTGAAREFAHRSAVDLMRECLRISGIPARGSDADVVRAALFTRSSPGLHTTSDFSTLLQDTANRRLGELFRAAESGASAIAATGTVRDFRPVTEVRLSSFPSLEKLNEGGEIQWGSLSDEGEKLAIGSYARAIGVTFQAMVNDDLSAIDRSIRDVAFATASLKAKLIVAALSAKLADGKALFHLDHANLASTDQKGAPSDVRLEYGYVAMAMQTPPGSTEPLGLTPSILLVRSEQEMIGRKLIASITPPTTDDVNPFSGRLQIAVEPRLPTFSEWFLFCSPSTYPVVRFLTLAGYEAPRFETEAQFDRLGMAFRVHWHVGAGPVDFRGAWKNAGA